MDESSGVSIANNVARAIAAALDWSSTPDDRKAAATYLETVKNGDIRFLANVSFILARKDWSSEIRLHAFKMLQHLVRLRWEELNSTERTNFAKVAFDLMYEIAKPCEEWALKSQTAALVAEIVRREGLNLWQELLPSLVSLSSKGPIQAELVSMMLRWLPEDITVHNEDLEGLTTYLHTSLSEGDRRRLLLRGLTQSLTEILPLLYALLETHFGAAMNEAGKQQLEIAKQHAASVIATLNAVNAYAEWAPLPDLAQYGIINGCGFLLSSPDFRLHACEFFKLVSSRKRHADASIAEFDSAIRNIFQILMNVASDFLSKSVSISGLIDESEVEFSEYTCESLVSLGIYNLQCISGDSTMLTLYLQQMLGFYRHSKFALHFQSLIFWLALMRDMMSKPKAAAQSVGDGSASSSNDMGASFGTVDNDKKKILSFVNDDMCSVILEISFQRVIKKEKVSPGTSSSLGLLELWSDDFDGKGDFSQYRSKLLELIRIIASHKPLIASGKVSERIIIVINNLLLSSMPAQDLAVVDSMQLPLENVVSGIFDGSNDFGGGNSEVQLALRTTFEGLLHHLLSLKWSEPALVVVLGHYFDALGSFLKHSPEAVGSVINKLFELLTSLPLITKDPSTNTARQARLQICTSFIRIAKSADRSILPHMKGIADTMAYLQRDGHLLRGEHNLLGEAFLVMASAAGSQQQQEVLAWLLEPLSQQWMQLEWQNNYFSEPLGLVKLCSETSTMWSIFHTVTFFERALKRSGIRKSHLNLQNRATASSLHPMVAHLSWMLPPLLKLLRALHSLWSPSVTQALPGEMKAAMAMSDIDRYNLLGEGYPKSSKGAMTNSDGSHVDMVKEGNAESETDIRNWLKGIRDSGYMVLGLSTTIGESFFKCVDSDSVAVSLVENLHAMEFRHLKQLVHSVLVPLIKFCPSDLWEVWLEKILHPLFSYSQHTLSASWNNLLHEGRAKVPDMLGILVGSDLKAEVMEEKLLRDVTREVCSLLSVIASPPLNTGLPSLEPSGHANRVDLSSLKDLNAFVSSSMVGFLLMHKSLAIPALHICLETLTWTDGEATTKISSFCTAIVLLAISTKNMELQELVSKDLFSAVIRGLALESNVFISADLVGLCRDIFVYLCDRSTAPRQVLLSLPCITPHDLIAFEESLMKTASPKEQKQHVKSLLMLASGNQLKALAAQKNLNVITNVSAKMRNSGHTPENRVEEGDVVGLASIL